MKEAAMADRKASTVGKFGLSGYLKVHAGSRPYTTEKSASQSVSDQVKKATTIERSMRESPKG